MTTSGAVTEYPVPTPNSSPYGITPGPDGALWFTESFSLKVGRLTLGGAITEFTVSTNPNNELGPITAGPDGALWFTEGEGDVCRIDTGGSISEYHVPTAPSGLGYITAGPDGALWFAEVTGEKIGRITPPGAAPPRTTRFFATNPPGLPVTVDGITYTTPQSFTWPVGSLHTIGAAAPAASQPGVRYLFAGWSDGQPQVHTIPTGPGPAVFVANMRIQYQLTTPQLPPSALPVLRGSVTLSPPSADGYYDAGTPVQLSAQANYPFEFAGWTGILAGGSNPGTVVMNAPQTVGAIFDVGSCAFTLSTSAAAVTAAGGTGTVGVATDSGCAWSVSSPASWVTITSPATGTGNGTVSYNVAASTNGVTRTAALSIAGQTFTITQGLSAMGVTPAAGSGLSQVFTMQFSNPSGYQNLGVINVLIANSLDFRQACYLAYSLPSNLLYLVNDSGSGLSPGMPLGGSGAVTNQQCLVGSSASSAVGSGTTLTLTLDLVFSPNFSGSKVVYLAAGDQAGNDSGWQALGTWTVPGTSPQGPAVGGVSPAHSNSPGQVFTFTFTDSNGGQDLGVVDILIDNFLVGSHACYLAYSRPLNALYLVDDNGASLTGLMLNGSGTLNNSQCAVYGVGSSAVLNGNTLTLNVNLAFLPGFSGDRVIYMAARSASGSQNSGWQASGSVTRP